MALFVSIQSLYYNNKGLHSNFIGHNNISFWKKKVMFGSSKYDKFLVILSILLQFYFVLKNIII
jgi:hypothetical protein